MNEYREVKIVTGLECTCEGKFRYKGKPKKVIYCKAVMRGRHYAHG